MPSDDMKADDYRGWRLAATGQIYNAKGPQCLYEIWYISRNSDKFNVFLVSQLESSKGKIVTAVYGLDTRDVWNWLNDRSDY